MIGRFLRNLCIAALLLAGDASRSYIVRLREHADVHVLASLVHQKHRDVKFSRHRGTVRETFAHQIFSGFVASDVSPAMHRELLNHPMVDRIYPDLPRQAYATTLPWGLDRLDQLSLPLDGVYRPQLNGEGVNAFILDSGIDTLHDEFKNSGRIVKNLYDHYIKQKSSPEANNDAFGHGTHVAGIVGGKYVGVAPNANIYGIKILDNKGAGTDSTVLAGLLHVANWVETERARTGREVPAVVCMSLGGSCLFPGCENEVMIDVLGNFSARGIHMVVAAGNDNCDSCNAAPAASADVITVGATTNSDAFATYSNKGQCVDVMAPGTSINSACSGRKCASESRYQLKTGTSMATPHVAGVVAQLLSVHPSATSEEIRRAVLCSAAKGKVRQLTSNMRNLLAQVLVSGQDVSTLGWTCDRGAGCMSSCSGRGDCISGQCICDYGFYGSQCESTSPTIACTSDNKTLVSLDMISFKLRGWPSLSYSLATSVGNSVKTGKLACGASSRDLICLEPGCYSLETKGKVGASDLTTFPWSICGISGYVPSATAFCIDDAGNCKPSFSQCLHNAHELVMGDLYGDGWGGGSLTAQHEALGSFAFSEAANPTEVYTTKTLAWGQSQTQPMCLEDGLYSLTAGGGEFPDEMSFSLCGADGSSEMEVAVLVNGTRCVQAFLRASFKFTASTSGYDNTISGSHEAVTEAVAAEMLRARADCVFTAEIVSVTNREGQCDWAFELTVELSSKQLATRMSVHSFMSQSAKLLGAADTAARIQDKLEIFSQQHAASEGGGPIAVVVVTTSAADHYNVGIHEGGESNPTPAPAPGPSPTPPSPSPAPKRTTKVHATGGLWVAVSVGVSMAVVGIGAAFLIVRSRSREGHQRLGQDDQAHPGDDGDDLVEVELFEGLANTSSSELQTTPWWRRWWAHRSPRMIVQLGSPGVTFAEDTAELLAHAQEAVVVATVSESEL